MTRLAAGDRFPNLRLDSVEGEVRLADLWRQGPLIVTFMRHFGCSFCREHLVRLSAADQAVRAAGGRTVAIFQYDAASTKGFCEGRDIPFACLGDPLREGYSAVALGRGSLRQLMGWQVIRRARTAVRVGGRTEGSGGGDIAQMPGTFVVDSGGRLVVSHYSRSAADNPDPAGLVAAVTEAAAT